MKRNWKNKLACAGMVWLLALLVSCSKDSAHEHDTYTCPMHPTVLTQQPGLCPVCGMDLVRKSKPGEAVEITEDLSPLLLSPNEKVIASIQTIKGEYKTLPVEIKAQGIVTYDPRNVYSLASRIEGRLEKVFVKFPYQSIAKGQKVAEVYSPELVTAQRELLFVLENDPANHTLISSAKEKLSVLGATPSQVSQLVQNKKVQNSFPVYSTREGFILPAEASPFKAPLPSPSGKEKSGMAMGSASTSGVANSSSQSVAPGSSFVREGSYVRAGETLYTLIDPATLRIELNLPATWSTSTNKKNKVELNFGDGELHPAAIDLVQPYFTEGQEFITMRLKSKWTKDLHLGHLVTAFITSDSAEALWLPREAVIDLGNEKVVFVRNRKIFEPKTVSVGIQVKEFVEIRHGLTSSDEVAANAQYLVDSESFIKPKKK